MVWTLKRILLLCGEVSNSIARVFTGHREASDDSSTKIRSKMVQFKVNDVKPDKEWVKRLVTQATNGEQQAKELAGAKRIEGFSHRQGVTFVNNFLGTKNPLLSAVYLAFSHHLPLVLTPDVIWNTIMQGVSTHVSQDPEKHRHVFVSHQGKKVLSVRDDSLRRGAPDNDWGRPTCQFPPLIAENLSGKAALQALNTQFSTTDDMARVAHAMVFMDVVKSYFEYRICTMCGIPSIELTGTKEDWQHLRSALGLLDELDLTPWRTQLDSILTHFEGAFDNKVEQSFWNDIFLEHGAFGSGGVTTISGWIGALFLYVNKQLNPVALGQGTKLRLDPVDFPSGLSETPFTWEYFGTEYPMLLRGGLVGVTLDQSTHAVAPQLGWLVTEAADDPSLQKNMYDY
ncbi:hypothetical protein KC19_9G082200 [Ceratodon purpureus]|uniref:Uncharacterized protein n=1 Tax=Ceratodon purpureus TaxID=3225 RepID=A0A8T0GU32_CERPU|nr:hypothetical protein KC19_9G082200 [Ceratodon purpureus]